MAELAPGLCVSAFVKPGTGYVMDLRAILGPLAPERGLAVNPRDWERLPGAERERILDSLIRQDADRGLRLMQAALAQL